LAKEIVPIGGDLLFILRSKTALEEVARNQDKPRRMMEAREGRI
jgi:hypothetical protein